MLKIAGDNSLPFMHYIKAVSYTHLRSAGHTQHIAGLFFDAYGRYGRASLAGRIEVMNGLGVNDGGQVREASAEHSRQFSPDCVALTRVPPVLVP